MTNEKLKRDSWAMARMLVSKGRISPAMAAWALKQSGHNQEEIERFIREKDAAAPVKQKAKNSQPVQCVETGKIFESMAAAALSVGRNKRAVSSLIRLNIRCGGYHWKRVDLNEEKG